MNPFSADAAVYWAEDSRRPKSDWERAGGYWVIYHQRSHQHYVRRARLLTELKNEEARCRTSQP